MLFKGGVALFWLFIAALPMGAHANEESLSAKYVTNLIEDHFYDEALKLLRKAPMGNDAEVGQVLLLTSRLYCQIGSPKSGIASLDSAATALGNNNPLVMLEQARVLLSLGDVKGSRELLAAVLKQKSTDATIKVEILILQARLEQALGNTVKALSLLGPAAESEALTLERSRIIQVSGSLVEARVALLDFIKVFPTAGRILFRAGRISEQLNEPEAAKSYYERASANFKSSGDEIRVRGTQARLDRLNKKIFEPEPPPPQEEPIKPAQALYVQTFPFPPGSKLVTGSGILIDQGRRIITNRHVIADGHNFYVRNALGDFSAVKVERVSDRDDLAVLILDRPFPPEKALRPDQFGQAKTGASIAVMGFPLADMLGSNTPTITNGIVSKTTGMQDNLGTFQISAKMNKGNSGGAVFDQSGHLIGVAVGKLDLVKIMQGEGFLPEDVNFAIHSGRVSQLAVSLKITDPNKDKTLSLEDLYTQYIGTVVLIAGQHTAEIK
ncbi:MAG: trypsin-like peptidase domain-containing protein [Candidatus Nitrotoga sp.]|nr:trypsin-like peptidase domain-containing protein [Candidatus Nitrotoga sp.]